jgi:putative DNA methylase
VTRMIERWFPCAEVSANSRSGWGSGNAETGLMTWFAKRPTAQAKAATICSLLPWPETEAEQKRLQALVQEAMTGRYSAGAKIRAEIQKAHVDNGSVSTLDPFSGRGMIPLETSRLGLPAHAIDYSPVAVMASRLLTDYPARNWDNEPRLTYQHDESALLDHRPRLVQDVDLVLSEIRQRHQQAMGPYFPDVDGRQPWGHLWAVTLPCHECSRHFPLIGSLALRLTSTRKGKGKKGSFTDPGQSYYIEADAATDSWSVVIHDGPPQRSPTRQVPPGKSRYDSNGRLAVCPFCGHGHDRELQMRILRNGEGHDAPLLAADLDPDVGKNYRPLKPQEREAITEAGTALATQPRFGVLLAARPDEPIPAGNTWTVQATVYGARTYGDMMNDRQTLSFITIAQIINDLASELTAGGCSQDYVRALTGYAAAAMSRKLRRATRGCTLDVNRSGVHDIFATESSLNFSFDYFEVGLADGPGSWDSVAGGTLTALGTVIPPQGSAKPCDVEQGSATALPFRDRSISAVVTDPPYDAMIDYSDASDLFYVWIKRALATSWPELGITPHEHGVQDKRLEIIVKKGGTSNKDHRDRMHYDTLITEAFAEAQRVVSTDGVVTIVFGHGEPEVWQRLLTAIDAAGLVLTGAWPAKTEQGGKVGFSNIVTTLTMACRPAPKDRPTGRKGAVDNLIRAEIKHRYPDWERWGLAPADMLMAAAGPAMEVVGRYQLVLDAKGEPVDIYTFLPLARAAVQEAMAVEIDHHPLETFDARTRFALWWVRLYGRQIQAKSELRWQALASSMDFADLRDLVPDEGKGVAFTSTRRFKTQITGDSAAIDVALALAAASEDGLAAMGEVLARSGRSSHDAYLWAAIKFLADRLPDTDPDAVALTRVLRTRDGISNAASTVVTNEVTRRHQKDRDDAQLRLL